MNKKTVVITSIIILAAFLLAFIIPVIYIAVGAEPLYVADLKSDIQKKKDEKADIRDKIDGIDDQKEDLLAEKVQMDREIQSIEGKVDDWNDEIAASDQRIAVKEAELTEATKKADEQYGTFKKRIRVMYEEGPVGYLDVLFSSGSLTDFFNRIEIVKQISSYDKTLLEKLKKARQEIQDKKAAVEEERSKQVAVRDQLKAQKTVLSQKQSQRDALMSNLNKTQDELEAREKKIASEEAALQAQYQAQLRAAAAASSGTPYTGGALLWPAPGYYSITSPFGYRYHPVLKYNKLHTGMDIGAPYGATVKAAADGTVLKAEFNSAYGNHIIINHGGGLATLYAHGSKLLVSAGQQVKKGDSIMLVGSTGYSTGAHLHFEVIKNGEYQNPQNYFK